MILNKKTWAIIFYLFLFLGRTSSQSVSEKRNISIINGIETFSDNLGYTYSSKYGKAVYINLYLNQKILSFNSDIPKNGSHAFTLNLTYLNHLYLIDSSIYYSIILSHEIDSSLIYIQKYYNNYKYFDGKISEKVTFEVNQNIIRNELFKYDSLNRIVYQDWEGKYDTNYGFVPDNSEKYFHYDEYPEKINCKGKIDCFFIDSTEQFVISNNGINQITVNDLNSDIYYLFPPSIIRIPKKIKHNWILKTEIDNEFIESVNNFKALFLKQFGDQSINLVNELNEIRFDF